MNNERRLDLLELLDLHFLEKMKNVYTAIPAHVLAFNPETQTAQVEIGIKRVDVNGQSYVPPPIIECPVLFSGDKWTLEIQIDPKCEGLAIFSQRCIDGWITTGGTAENPLCRFHDISDALFIPGFRPNPTAIKSFSNNGIRLRNADGSQFAWLKNDGSIAIENGKGHIKIAKDGTVTINGVTIDVNGNITTQSTVTAQNNIVGGGISLNSHRHSGVESGLGTSGGPI